MGNVYNNICICHVLLSSKNISDQHTLIHRIFFAFDFLVIFMTFTSQHHNIPWFSVMYGISDCLLAVLNLHIFTFCLRHAHFDVINNSLRFLITGII